MPERAESPIVWVKAVRELGSTGAVIAMAAYLVYRLASGIPSAQDVTEVKGMLTTHVTATAVEMTQIKSILRVLCMNSANTEQQRAACQAAGQ